MTGPAGADDLDPVIHAPARLRIMATLAALKGTVQGLDDLNPDAPEPGGDTPT
jgi:hypothetical protein